MEKSLHPTSVSERQSLLDILRGFALLGVLLANMVSHSGYFFISKSGQEALGTLEVDHYVEWVEHFLIDGKFYSLFSLLFGIGFALQMKRASASDVHFTSRFRRRLFIMFVIGLLHAVLLFVGDILTVYALTGFVLILFRNAPDKILLRSAIILFLLPVLQYAVFWGINLINPSPPVVEEGPRFLDEVIRVFQTGSYLEIIQMNTGGLIMGRYPDLFFTGRFFKVLAMFLIGFYVAKNMIHSNLGENRRLFRRVMIWGAVIGIPCNLVLAMMMTTEAYYNLEPTGIIQSLVYAFGVPALALCYASIFALLYQNPEWKTKLMIFAPVGQLALTNYLMQSLLCAIIFMSYGFGMEAKIGPARLSLIALGIYVFQIVYSHLWIKAFHFGPMEWLWRSLTYKKRQPFRKQ
ncbi:DUF418 domain-containing protein [Dyadobacter sp. CY312]|uniref:DUF418 domain-containing protein n=1 Tax=Dyadobacter sp. CY312 TaxID=2907303 RepID=UPI001F27AE2E|nr:DUF418 domain-containing protein [Dyadobacter sp. CY312]MCE7039100.1 DUF418 domain-containing protein [Dyadobacter sp. CY312]